MSEVPAHDPLNPATFVAPELPTSTTIIIEFCDRCRWLHRATWTQTELFLTFPPPNVTSITLIPRNTEETAGRFRVWLITASEPPKLMWDRKTEGGFPELKFRNNVSETSSSQASRLATATTSRTARRGRTA
ncbi:Rdx family-domain-containing protein, partial [Schizophyllum commune]